jgi:flagellar biosynthesis/type III secretory pathway protein FliH
MLSSDAVAYRFEQLDAGGTALDGAADVLSAAWAEVEQLRESARTEGFDEGRSQGLEQARAEVQLAVDALNAATVAVESLRSEIASAFERDAVDFALRLSEQVVAGALEAQPERVVDIARGALRRIADRRRVTLVVNPDDLELVSGVAASMAAELGGIEQCDVQADRRVARGGAIARTVEGEIDAGIETQLAQARELVVSALTPSTSEA